MRTDRQANQVRAISLTPGFNEYAEGSVLLEWGKNKVLATLTIDNKLPPHLRGSKKREGWLTAEYALLPRSTQERVNRERLYSGGRTQEIQRLIGRSLRSIVNLSLFPNKTLIVDVDILQADGGTRCAAILAGYAALHHAANAMIFSGMIDEWPLTHEIAAVSIGQVDGQDLIDLEFSEDKVAELDLNVVATAEGQIIEVQGGGEEGPIPAEKYVQLVAAGTEAIKQILATVRPQLK